MLQENIDYYINEDGNFVFTREYHLKRGYCCKNKCLHCPWNFGRDEQEEHDKKHKPIYTVGYYTLKYENRSGNTKH